MNRRDFILVAALLRAANASPRVVSTMADGIEDATQGRAGFDRARFIAAATSATPKED